MKVNLFIPSIVAAGLLAGGVAFSGISQAEPTALGGQSIDIVQANGQAISDKRRDLMKGISKARKTLSKKAKAGSIGAAEVAQAEKIAALSNQLTGMWPKGSGSDMVKSRAKPAIWTDNDDFNKRLAKMQKAAADGVKAAKAGDAKAVTMAMKGMSCGGCHKRYRGPKPK